MTDVMRVINCSVSVGDICPPKLEFTNKKWAAADVINVIHNLHQTPYHYRFGTIFGIYVKTSDGGKDIISVDNLVPHNGYFELFLDALEKYATKTGERIAICAFFNEKLYWHIRRRTGWGNTASTMDRLEYYPQKTKVKQ